MEHLSEMCILLYLAENCEDKFQFKLLSLIALLLWCRTIVHGITSLSINGWNKAK